MKTLSRIIGGACLYCLGYGFYTYEDGSIRASATQLFNADSAWSKKNRDFVYNNAYKSSLTIFPMENQRKAFAECVLSKMQSKLPKGMKSISVDSLKTVTRSIGYACGRDVGLRLSAWTFQLEAEVRRQLLLDSEVNKLTDKAKKYYCTCYINTLKQLYPQGVTKAISTDTVKLIQNRCVNELIKHQNEFK